MEFGFVGKVLEEERVQKKYCNDNKQLITRGTHYVGEPIVANDVDQLKDPNHILTYSIVSGNSYNSGNGNIANVFAFSVYRRGQIVVNNPGVACGTPSETEAEQCGTRTNDPAIKYDVTGTETAALVSTVKV